MHLLIILLLGLWGLWGIMGCPMEVRGTEAMEDLMAPAERASMEDLTVEHMAEPMEQELLEGLMDLAATPGIPIA